jgi:hypothetical protein
MRCGLKKSTKLCGMLATYLPGKAYSTSWGPEDSESPSEKSVKKGK